VCESFAQLNYTAVYLYDLQTIVSVYAFMTLWKNALVFGIRSNIIQLDQAIIVPIVFIVSYILQGQYWLFTYMPLTADTSKLVKQPSTPYMS